MKIAPGTIIADMYRADAPIGAGGMGEVWRGVRLSDQSAVAIKVLLPNLSNASEVYARFRREAQVLARVDSPYAAHVLDFLGGTDGFVLVMELIPGPSLHAVLSERGRLPLEQMLLILEDILHGLCDLHRVGIVHRDLKPGNVVLRQDPGGRARAVLIDFGVSRIIADPDEEEVTAITRGDRVLGTIEYMAPEQILGSRSVTGTADLYAAGAMTFRAIAGFHVFGDLQEGQLAVAKLNEDPPALKTGRNDEVGRRTEALVARLLSRRLRDRFETAEQVLEEVQSIIALFTPKSPAASDVNAANARQVQQSAPGVAMAPTQPHTGQSLPSAVPAPEFVPARVATVIPAVPAGLAQPVGPTVGSSGAGTAADAIRPSVASSVSSVSVNTLQRRPKRSWAPWIVAFFITVGGVVGALAGVSYARQGVAQRIVGAACSRIGVDDQAITNSITSWVFTRLGLSSPHVTSIATDMATPDTALSTQPSSQSENAPLPDARADLPEDLPADASSQSDTQAADCATDGATEMLDREESASSSTLPDSKQTTKSAPVSQPNKRVTSGGQGASKAGSSGPTPIPLVDEPSSGPTPIDTPPKKTTVKPVAKPSPSSPDSPGPTPLPTPINE